MNFLAGFFYLTYKDEAMSFAMLASLIKKMNISGFYHHNVPLAMKYFYQMNRLVALYFPALHANFFESGVSVVFFASSWFLTSYCYVLQYGKDTTVPPLLVSFFDKYLLVYFFQHYRMGLLCS